MEHLNAECKSKLAVTLQKSLSDVYRLYKSVCAKHLGALKECSISYCDKTESAKKASAAKRQKQRLVSSLPTDPRKHMGHQIELPTLTQHSYQKRNHMKE